MGLKHFKCPRGDTVAGVWESGPELRICADSGYVGVWGTDGMTLLVFSGALILTGTRASSQCCSVSAVSPVRSVGSILQVWVGRSK